MKKILVVDDEPSMREMLGIMLRREGYEIVSAENRAVAAAVLAKGPVDMVITDVKLPDGDGIEILRHVKAASPGTVVIVMTAFGTTQTAVAAMKLGAHDYLTKPFDVEELKIVVRGALDKRRLEEENLLLKAEFRSRHGLDRIIGVSKAMEGVFDIVRSVAPTNSTVLITGDSGTGKELVAKAIHTLSPRCEAPFVSVNCGALSESLLESELFGHVKGSFTGAVANKRGLFDVANGGTLFLDEIGNISLATQAKLLRVIQEREFKAVGDTRTQSTDIRMIAATNKDLKAMVAEGSFRDDLFYRINIFPIRVPPLRERREDIPALAYHFLNGFAKELGKKLTGFSDGAMNVLVNFDWPGNVRELENCVHRATILATDEVIRKAHLADIVGDAASDVEVPRTGEELKRVKKAARERSVEDIEKLFVLEALKRNGWNVTRSAEETGMQRANFQALMKKHRIRLRGTESDAGESGAS